MKNSTKSTRLSQVIPYCQKMISGVALVCTLVSCKKSPTVYNTDTNELKVSVVISVGDTAKINYTGKNVEFGCSSVVISDFGISVQENYPALRSVFSLNTFSSCPESPPTNDCLFEIMIKNSVGKEFYFRTKYPGLGGKITFTRIEGQRPTIIEGYFSGVGFCNTPGCPQGVDSVVVSGTFKGGY